MRSNCSYKNLIDRVEIVEGKKRTQQNRVECLNVATIKQRTTIICFQKKEEEFYLESTIIFFIISGNRRAQTEQARASWTTCDRRSPWNKRQIEEESDENPLL